MQNKAEINNFLTLSKKSYDVKFDLENTDYIARENIGSGAYGVVCSAVHKITGEKVAIKKIPDIFEHLTIAKRTYREIKILKHFKHDNVIRIQDILKPSSVERQAFKDIYVVMDLMETDLHQIIYSKQDITDEHIRYFLYQTLHGLKYIHSANVIHRDLKPSNLLLNENCDLKIGDFGMARLMSSSEDDHNLLMTLYVATRWYRAPELLLFRQQYTTAVDMWSVGCILAELLGRRPIFPGRDLHHQITLVVGILGSPSEDFIDMAHSERIKDFLRKLDTKPAIPLKDIYPKSHPKAVRLLEKMLKLNPRERITVDDALKDPYLSNYHDPNDEPICTPQFNFDLDEKSADLSRLRQAIYNEILEQNTDISTSPTQGTHSSLKTNQLVPCCDIERENITSVTTADPETIETQADLIEMNVINCCDVSNSKSKPVLPSSNSAIQQEVGSNNQISTNQNTVLTTNPTEQLLANQSEVMPTNQKPALKRSHHAKDPLRKKKKVPTATLR